MAVHFEIQTVNLETNKHAVLSESKSVAWYQMYKQIKVCLGNIHRVQQKKKCIHTLTKENSMLYVRTNFNYTSQVEYTLQQSTIQISRTCTVNGGVQSGCR